MGIKELAKVIADHSQNGIKVCQMKEFFGRRVAVDASMSLYQFLIAVRMDGGAQLQDDEGNTTSHLNGMFYRTIRMMENGVRPVYVFDGKPPELKIDELDKRTTRRADTQVQLDEAKEIGDKVAIEKFDRRMVKVTKDQNEECKRLLRSMGVPVVEAPCEAEAQCAELVRAGKVFATATEDMDALTFGSKILIRHMTFSEAKKVPLKEFNLEKILHDLQMSQDQFIDLCILLGCDYCPTIRGIGPKKAFDLITAHKSIECVLEHLDPAKYPVPENWLFAAARELFRHPEVKKGEEFEDFVWHEPNSDEIVQFLCTEKGFSEDRVRNAVERLRKTRRTATQSRLDTFFKPIAHESTSTPPSAGEPSAKKSRLAASAKDKKKSAATKKTAAGVQKKKK